MKQRLFILGATGSVGREFIRQVLAFDQEFCEIVGLASSRQFVFDASGFAFEDEAAVQVKLEENGSEYGELQDFLNLVADPVVFVDLTAGKEDLLAFHLAVIQNTLHRIVTANKNPLALGSMDDFKTLTQDPLRYRADVTVMAGGGPVGFVQQRTLIQDEIVSIQGCFSGTLTYILSELDHGMKSFSQIVRDAKESGYTEPNPWDDLNGVDVARKVLILARYAGFEVNFEDIDLEPLIAEQFGDLEGAAFLDSLVGLDDNFEMCRVEAERQGNVLRYVGQIEVEGDQVKLQVRLQEVERDSAIGSLSGTENIMVAQTRYMSDPIPHVIKSRGAGLEVTASAMRLGVLEG